MIGKMLGGGEETARRAATSRFQEQYACNSRGE